MSKTITLDYKEFVSMQDEIKKLKEQNSMLSQGAKIINVHGLNVFYGSHGIPWSDYDIAKDAVYDAQSLVDVCGQIVAKGAKNKTYFAGIETLENQLKSQIRRMDRALTRYRSKGN